MEMNFEITENLCFNVDYLAYRIAVQNEGFFNALENGDMEDDYYRLDENQQKALRTAIFKRCVTILEEKED